MHAHLEAVAPVGQRGGARYLLNGHARHLARVRVRGRFSVTVRVWVTSPNPTLRRLPLINTPLLLLNAYDDPIVPGASLVDAIAHARVNEHIVMALDSHGSGSDWG